MAMLLGAELRIFDKADLASRNFGDCDCMLSVYITNHYFYFRFVAFVNSHIFVREQLAKRVVWTGHSCPLAFDFVSFGWRGGSPLR
jgi:hypothetical protein